MMIRRPIPEPLLRLPANPRPRELLDAVCCATEPELRALCRLYLIESIPAVFAARPIEYENVRVSIAVGLGIEPWSVGLVGSARVGYSLHPRRFPRDFSPASGLDFSVIDPAVFAECLRDAGQWRDDVQSGRLPPRNAAEQRYWEATIASLDEVAGRGHLDPKVILEREEYRRISEVRNTMRRAGRELTYLGQQHRVLVRIYRDWDCFYRHQIGRLRQLRGRRPDPELPALSAASA